MPLDLRRSDRIAEIRLVWPEVRNALGPAEARELRLAFEGLAEGPDKPHVVILGADGRAFCAGGNLKTLAEVAKAGPKAIRDVVYGEFQGLFRALHEAPFPIIVAVDGPAIGLGADLALAGDVVFMGKNAWLAQGWMTAGLIPATGGIRTLVEKGGRRALWQMLLTDRLSPEQADGLGLATAVPEAGEAAAAAAARLAAMPQAPLFAMRRLARISDFEAHQAAALDQQVAFLSSEAFQVRARELLGGRR